MDENADAQYSDRLLPGEEQPIVAPDNAVSAGEVHDLTELELAFVSGPFRRAQQDVAGLKELQEKLGKELSDLFDSIDVNGNGCLEFSEVLVLAVACGYSREDAAMATKRFFLEVLGGSRSKENMSRRQWFVFFHYLTSFRDSNSDSKSSLLEGRNLYDVKAALSDLAQECSAETASSLANGLALVGCASLFHTLICVGLLFTCTFATHLARDVDILYTSLLNTTSFNSTGFKHLEDTLFSNFFAESANTLFIVTASFGVLIGIFMSSQTLLAYRHAKLYAVTDASRGGEGINLNGHGKARPVLRSRGFGLFSVLTGLLSSAILTLSCLQYLQIGNGETMCLQACGSICADSFPNSSAGGKADDDFLACQAFANQNCSCGLEVLKGRSYEQQTIEIFASIPEARSSLFLEGNFTVTFDGYTSTDISIDTTPETLAKVISTINYSKSGKNASTLGSVYGPVAASFSVNKPRRKKWKLMFKGCFESLGKPVIALNEVQLTNRDGSITGGGVISSTVDVLQRGRSGTEFYHVHNSFDGIFSDVAVIGVVCSSAVALTSLLAGVLGCSYRCCRELRVWMGLGKIQKPHKHHRFGIIQQRLLKVFEEA